MSVRGAISGWRRRAGTSAAHDSSVMGELVEAAGRRSFALDSGFEVTLYKAKEFEPLLPSNPNPMMANDFGFYCVKSPELARRFESPGVLPSLGDIMETLVSSRTPSSVQLLILANR